MLQREYPIVLKSSFLAGCGCSTPSLLSSVAQWRCMALAADTVRFKTKNISLIHKKSKSLISIIIYFAVPLFEDQLEEVALQLERLPLEQRVRVLRVLQIWWKEGVFAPGVVDALQRRFAATMAAAPAAAHPAPAASATACPWEGPGCQVIMMSSTPSSIEPPASPPSPPPPRFSSSVTH